MPDHMGDTGNVGDMGSMGGQMGGMNWDQFRQDLERLNWSQGLSRDQIMSMCPNCPQELFDRIPSGQQFFSFQDFWSFVTSNQPMGTGMGTSGGMGGMSGPGMGGSGGLGGVGPMGDAGDMGGPTGES